MKFHIFLSFANSDSGEFYFGVPTGCSSLSLPGQLLLACLLLCPENSIGTPQAGGPRRWLDREVGCSPFADGVLLSVASSQGKLSLSFF